MHWIGRFAPVVLWAVAGLAALYAVAALLFYWDPSRVTWKRVIERDPYRYEKTDPELKKRDPASHLHIKDAADAARVRAQLIAAIWGPDGLPTNKQPSRIEHDLLHAGIDVDCPKYHDPRPLALALDCALDRYRGMKNLGTLDRIHVNVHSGYEPEITHFQPALANGRLILYQHGFAGTYHEVHRHIARLVAAGYGVMAMNLMGYGDNLSGAPGREREHRLDAPRPMRFFYEPVIVALNYGLGRAGYQQADMIGFSVGGYIAAMSAAIDPRIRRTYAVASPFPVFLRDSAKAGPTISRWPAITKAASQMDAYLLASLGEGRGLILIHNRFDKCCWGNRTATLVAPAIRDGIATAGGQGEFRVLIDETHARHKVSGYAMDAILADLGRP